ncbi:MAG: molybdopterin-dependent oxidoreductase [Chryseolinea sp.]
MKTSSVIITLLLTCCIQFVAFAQTATIKVEGEVLTPLSLTLDDLSRMPVTKVKAKDKEAKEHDFSGVTLYEVLKKAGGTFGPQLKGENMAKFVLIKAADGYQVVYALAEIDPEFTGDLVILAYQVDGGPLPKGEGPFRLVAPADKKHSRWIRDINTIKVLSAKE